MIEVDVLILAAGFSSRAGTFKPALDLGGKTLIARCVETFHDLCTSVIIVTGHEADRIAALVSGYPKVRLVHNADYADGMFSSVRTGVGAVSAPRFFLIPGDHPLVSPRTCEQLLAAVGNVIVPSFSGKAGHPVLIDASLNAEILAEAPASNLKAILSRHERTFVTVDDPGVLFDVDTMDDYQKALAAF